MSRKLLARARRARREGDGPGVLAALEEAVVTSAEAGDESLLTLAAWRLSKAHHDYGTPEGALDALDWLQTEGRTPWEGYARAREGMERLSAWVTSTAGYGDPRLVDLWRGWLDALANDPWRRAQGTVQLAWVLACRGDLDALRQLAEGVFRTSPSRFGTGPTAHPDAPDTPTSVYYAQLELARVLLRGATWVGDTATAEDALDAWYEAAGAVEVEPDYWLLEAHAHASVRLGWGEGLDDFAAAHAALDHPRARVHRPLGAAILALDAGADATLALRQAAASAREEHVGYEWEALALAELHRLGAGGSRLKELVRTTGVAAFAP